MSNVRTQKRKSPLFVMPVGRLGPVLAGLRPYAVLGFAETMVVLSVTVYLFDVPIQGGMTLSLSLCGAFLVCALSSGLLMSTLAMTQVAALILAFVVTLPSLLLSGFMFRRSEMPASISVLTFVIPVTHLVEILRGIVLRGADVFDLVSPMVWLTICALTILGIAVARFRKPFAQMQRLP